jgi:hypothetical protein
MGLQELQLADDLMPDLESGEKTATVRAGARAIVPGRLDFVAVESKKRVTVEVREVRIKRAYGLTDAEAMRDGADSAEELLEGMKRFYPHLTQRDVITVVLHDPPGQ